MPEADDIAPELLDKLNAVTAKRPRAVIQHIIEHGQVTTEELKERYGYNHPPRAARDVREQGIPLETVRVRDSTGRSIGAYKLGDLSDIKAGRLGGRQVAPKAFKDALVEAHGGRCAVCGVTYESRYLQVDHRIPYDILSEADSPNMELEAFMPLCASDNRAKGWSCENCENMTTIRDPQRCETCLWASPENYEHIALREERRLVMTWRDRDVEEYESLSRLAAERGSTVGEVVVELLRNGLASDG